MRLTWPCHHIAGVTSHRSCPDPFSCATGLTATRPDPKRRKWARRSARTGCLPLLWHQLRSAPCQRLPVQATSVFRHEAAKDACAYVLQRGRRKSRCQSEGIEAGVPREKLSLVSCHVRKKVGEGEGTTQKERTEGEEKKKSDAPISHRGFHARLVEQILFHTRFHLMCTIVPIGSLYLC